MAEEKEKRKVGERRSAQRIKRVLADTTPKHLEQLTKQARALAGDDGEADDQDVSMDAIRRKLGHLHKRHTVLREKLTSPSPPQKSLVARLQAEFGKESEGKRLEGEDWNDSAIKELQERIYSGDAAGSALEDDQEANGQLQSGDDQRGEEDLILLVSRKVIRGVKGGHIIIRFDTAYEDQNFESYYCVLKSSSALDKLHVIEHSIPFFLPVRELEKQHLGSSPRTFIDHMGDVLQAYVSRREQVNDLKKLKGDLIGQLYHSLSYTLIEIMVKEPQCQVGLSLAYHNSYSELPTQSTITAWPLSSDLITQTAAKRPGRALVKNPTAFRLPKAEAFLRTMPLPRGFSEFLTDLRETLGLSPPVQLPAIKSPMPVPEAPKLAIESPQPAIGAPKIAMETPQSAIQHELAMETPLSAIQHELAMETPLSAIQHELAMETPQSANQDELAMETPLSAIQHELAMETPQSVIQHELAMVPPQSAIQHELGIETPQLTIQDELAMETPQSAIQHELAMVPPQSAIQHELGIETPQLTIQHDLAMETPELTIRDQLAMEAPQSAIQDQLAMETPQSPIQDQLAMEAPQSVIQDQLAMETPQSAIQDQLAMEAPQSAIQDLPIMPIDGEPMVIESPMEPTH